MNGNMYGKPLFELDYRIESKFTKPLIFKNRDSFYPVIPVCSGNPNSSAVSLYYTAFQKFNTFVSGSNDNGTNE